MDDSVLRTLMQSQRGSELIRGMLQTMRDTALDAVTTKARDGIEGRSDAWIHMQLGRAAALEDAVRHFVQMTLPGENAEMAKSGDSEMLRSAEDEAMLGEVPRK